MTTITSSPITFLDLTDQQQLSAYLTSNLPTVQVYGADGTYTPSWDENNLIITLHAFLNQEEIDYTNTDYKFTWSVKDGGREEVIKTGTDQTLIINSNKLITSDTGMLTYICEIQCPTADTITTEMTYTLISDGKDGEDGKAVVFSVYSSDGTIFRNQSGEIKLETLKYYGSDEIVYNTGLQNPSFKWYKLSSDGETLISGATTDTYTVYGEDVLNIASYKCEMTYNDVVYSDVITLQDVSDNYTSDILTIGGTVFKNGIGGSAAYIIIRANGTEEDALAGIVSATAPSSPKTNDYWYCIDNSNDTIIKKKYTSGRWTNVSSVPQTLKYNWYLMDVDGNITKNFASEKVIYLSCTDVDDTTTLCCEVSSSDGKLLTISQETFVDLYDSYNVTITPDVVSVACDNNGNVVYKNNVETTSSEEYPVLVYNFEYSVKAQNSNIDASCTIDAVEGLTIDTSQNGIIKVTTCENFNFGDADSFSLPVKITTNDKQNFTFERYITFIKVREGESAVSFDIYSPQGDTFTEGVEEITIRTVAYCGASLITNATYAWYYYEETANEGGGDNWHQVYKRQISADGTIVEEIAAESQDLFVNKNDYYAFLTLKCVMHYNNVDYEAYFLLKNYYNPYTATIRFLNESNVIGVNDLFVVAYAELYKNNIIIDDLFAKEFYYNETIEITDGIINVDIKPEITEDQTTGYFKYFIYKSIIVEEETNAETNEVTNRETISYPIILGEYVDNSWKVVENYNDYVYKNNLYPNLNSKIITIPKEEIEDSREITFYIYNTFENNEGVQVYDNDLLIAKSDTIIINLNDKLGDIVEVTKNVQEYMNFSPSDGLTIAQKESEDANAKFYVNINSKQMAFHEVDDDGKDNKVVVIANNRADIKNLTVGADDKGDADFNCPISVNNQINIVNTSASQTDYPGFSFQVEIDGSLSLIKMGVN